MNLDSASFDHVCNVVRRDVQEEFKNLTIFFLPYTGDNYKKVLKNKHFEIKEHPASHKIRSVLEDIKKSSERPEGIAGLCYENTHPLWMPAFKRRQELAVVFIPVDHFDSPESVKIYAYHMAWHVLYLAEMYKRKVTECYVEMDEVVKPAHDKVRKARDNMLADAFVALVMAARSHDKNFIDDFVERRCAQTLNKTLGMSPENFPFPITIDITQMVYEEYEAEHNDKSTVLRDCLKMVKEVNATFDDAAIQQWIEFASGAQEMAWMNIEAHTILDLATYTSEDPYSRLIAYLLAESLGMKTSSDPNLNQYNAFTDPGKNARLHKKTAQEFFTALMNGIKAPDKRDKILEEICLQNKNLIEGQPLGWCAPAMVIAHTIFGEESTNLDDLKLKARKAFDQMLEQMTWDTVRTLHHMITEKQKRGETVTVMELQNMTENHEEIQILSPAFSETIQIFEKELAEKKTSKKNHRATSKGKPGEKENKKQNRHPVGKPS